MRNGHSRDSRNCADFALGLAVTGMRKGEANALEWRDIDFELAEIIVRGGKPNGFGKSEHGSGTPHLNQNPKWKLAATRLHRLQAAGPNRTYTFGKAGANEYLAYEERLIAVKFHGKRGDL